MQFLHMLEKYRLSDTSATYDIPIPHVSCTESRRLLLRTGRTHMHRLYPTVNCTFFLPQVAFHSTLGHTMTKPN